MLRRVGFAGLLVCLTALGGYSQHQGATATAGLSIRVVPESELRREGDAVRLRIRLARGALATLWSSDDCTVAPSGGPLLTIAKSGTYLIPISSVQGTGGKLVCLASSEGLLHSTLAWRKDK